LPVAKAKVYLCCALSVVVVRMPVVVMAEKEVDNAEPRTLSLVTIRKFNKSSRTKRIIPCVIPIVDGRSARERE